jgi:phospholipid/cholesterol/gamma-HCH transport system substrate-binding protein
MTEKTKRRRPVKPPQKSEIMTVLVILSVTLSIGGYLVWSRLEEPFILKAKYDYADGLKIGAEVQVAGVKVGSVDKVKFIEVPSDSSKREFFEIHFKIDPTINGKQVGEIIRKDAQASLVVTSTLGDRSIDINPGTPQAGPVKSGDYIRGNVEPTVSMVMDSYEAMNSNFNRVREIMELSVNGINEGRGTVGKFYTREVNRNIEKLVKDTEALQIEIDRGKGTIGRFNSEKRLQESIDRLNRTTEKLRKSFEQGEGTAGKFLKDPEFQQRVDQLEARATRISETLNRIMERTEKGSGSLASFNKGDRFKRDFNQLKKSADNISQTLSTRKGTAGLLVYDNRLSQNVGTISTELAKLLYDVREKPRKYVKFTLF